MNKLCQATAWPWCIHHVLVAESNALTLHAMQTRRPKNIFDNSYCKVVKVFSEHVTYDKSDWLL